MSRPSPSFGAMGWLCSNCRERRNFGSELFSAYFLSERAGFEIVRRNISCGRHTTSLLFTLQNELVRGVKTLPPTQLNSKIEEEFFAIICCCLPDKGVANIFCLLIVGISATSKQQGPLCPFLLWNLQCLKRGVETLYSTKIGQVALFATFLNIWNLLSLHIPK